MLKYLPTNTFPLFSKVSSPMYIVQYVAFLLLLDDSGNTTTIDTTTITI